MTSVRRRGFRPVEFDVKEVGTRSHERTLLARLGFADPDKSNARHDLACAYLAAPERARRVAAMCGEGVPPASASFGAVHETVVSKGAGAYGTTIGFLDLGLRWQWDQFRRLFVAVEVKITPVGFGDILRQIRLYAAHDLRVDDELVCPDRWVVVVDFDLSIDAVEALASADVLALRLGPDFDQWIARQRKAARLRTI